MKKKYNKPYCKAIEIDETQMIAESGGVAVGCSLGNDYNESDVSYTKELGSGISWNEEW